MLATTTASYDESNLMEVLEDILHDEGMLDSRANPGEFNYIEKWFHLVVSLTIQI
jgi:hypothetical protein